MSLNKVVSKLGICKFDFILYEKITVYNKGIATQGASQMTKNRKLELFSF